MLRFRLPLKATTSLFSTSTKLMRDQLKREIKFSESAAYQGLDRRQFNLNKSTWQPDYYSTDSYRNKKLLSALLSLVGFLIYFGCIRFATSFWYGSLSQMIF